MVVALFIFFIVAMCIAVIAGVVSGIRQSSTRTGKQVGNTIPRAQEKAGIDSINPPPSLSPEEQEHIRKVAAFCGTRYVTQADLRRYTIHKIGEEFGAMSGWDIWDSSIHEAPGQYERLGRALNKEINILSYDPEYRLAKIQGQSSIYLTSCKRCSCPDYRERRLPCKHMYALALELDGNVDKYIASQEYGLFYGLVFALAGRFTGTRAGADGIRSQIEALGGKWSDNVSRECSALITGTDPSSAKIERAAYFDMEVLPVDAVSNLFTSKIKKYKYCTDGG